MSARFTTRRGFTLIELLVVIAIIAILASLLFPALARSKDKGKAAQCQSNIRQLALAAMMFEEDNQVYPVGWNANSSTIWYRQLQPYLGRRETNPGGGVFICPSSLQKAQPDEKSAPAYAKAASGDFSPTRKTVTSIAAPLTSARARSRTPAARLTMPILMDGTLVFTGMTWARQMSATVIAVEMKRAQAQTAESQAKKWVNSARTPASSTPTSNSSAKHRIPSLRSNATERTCALPKVSLFQMESVKSARS